MLKALNVITQPVDNRSPTQYLPLYVTMQRHQHLDYCEDIIDTDGKEPVLPIGEVAVWKGKS